MLEASSVWKRQLSFLNDFIIILNVIEFRSRRNEAFFLPTRCKKIMSHAWCPCQIENFLVFPLLITRLRFHMLIKNLVVSIIAADIDFTNLIKKNDAPRVFFSALRSKKRNKTERQFSRENSTLMLRCRAVSSMSTLMASLKFF